MIPDDDRTFDGIIVAIHIRQNIKLLDRLVLMDSL